MIYHLFRTVSDSVGGGLVCALFAIGTAGLFLGIPLVFHDFLPDAMFGQPEQRLQELPGYLAVAGAAGLAVGLLAGVASRLPGKRISFATCALVIGAAAVYGTVSASTTNAESSEPLMSLSSVLAAARASLVTTFVMIGLGFLYRPFVRKKQINHVLPVGRTAFRRRFCPKPETTESSER